MYKHKTTGLSPEPARWWCDNCQLMSDFDNCQWNRTHTDGLHNWKASQVVQDLLWHLTSAYMECVYGWAYATSWPNFLGWIVYQILLPMVLRCARLARENSASNFRHPSNPSHPNHSSYPSHPTQSSRSPWVIPIPLVMLGDRWLESMIASNSPHTKLTVSAITQIFDDN